MNLIHGLPSALEAHGLTITIKTGAAAWMWVASRMHGLNETAGLALLERLIEKIERNGREVAAHELTGQESSRLFERMHWFMRGGEDVPQAGKPAKERLIDYERDLTPLYAAFLQFYGVDLYADDNGKPLIETLHWWRFLALAGNLPSGSMLTDYYMHYRGVDVSKLPRKTSADKEHLRQVIEIKRQVGLESKKTVKPVQTIPPYAKRAQELKARQKNV